VAKTRKLVIAIDCDDVLVSSVPSLLAGYNAMFGTRVRVEHFYEPATMDTWGTDDDDLARRQFEQYLRSDEYSPAPPIVHATRAVEMLAKEHELHLITGRAEDRELETRGLVDRYFPGCFASIEHTNHYVSSDYSVVTRSKGEVCRDIHADILVDDHIFHGREALEMGLERALLFGDYPWNQGELPEGMQRCADWFQVLEEVRRIAGR
jgi:hypothetical protein